MTQPDPMNPSAPEALRLRGGFLRTKNRPFRTV